MATYLLSGKRVGEIGYFGERLKGGLAINSPKTFKTIVLILYSLTIVDGHRNKATSIV